MLKGGYILDKKNKVIVRINGREYAIRGSESEDYIHKVAIYVDKKMDEITRSHPPLSTTMLAILTALNLSNEILKQKDEIELLKQQIDELNKNILSFNNYNQRKGANKSSRPYDNK